MNFQRFFDSCLKFRQTVSWGLLILIGAISIVLVSCGVKTNQHIDQEKQNAINSFFQLDSKCSSNINSKSQIYIEIQNFYSKVIYSAIRFKGNWLDESRFHFLKPMVVNEEILKGKLEDLSIDFNKGEIEIKKLLELVEMANRYEGQKCNFNELIEKKNTDLTSYLNLTHQCAKKSQSECSESVLALILNQDSEQDIINLCTNFKRIYQCKREYDFSKRAQNLEKMTKYYLDNVDQQKFQSLFQLRPNHSRYKCEKNAESVSLFIRIYNDGFEEYRFSQIVDQIVRVWSKKGLKIVVQVVEYGSEFDLKISGVENQISHVKNDDLRTMYLDRNLDQTNLINVAAHEFGHILGFPDCYIEYFDSVKNALVYYELSPQSRNIMCSLKSGFKVEDSYIDQITEKACKF